MKLLLFARWRTTSPGGPDAVILNLAREFVALGHDVTVWSPSKRIAEVSAPRAEAGVTVVEVPVFPRLPLLKRATREFVRAQAGAFDAAMFFSVFTPANSLIARELRCPYGVAPLGGYASESIRQRGRLRKMVFLALCERELLERARFVNVWSQNEREDVELLCRPRKFIITPPGFEALSMPEREPRVEHTGRRIVFLGRFAIQHKGLDRLVKAFEAVASPADTLTLAGADFRGGLAVLELARETSPVRSQIGIEGPAFGDAKYSLFQRTDVFVHLSRWEGLPLAVVEALAFGIPVLVSRNTNAGEYVKAYDAGWVVENGDCSDGVRQALSASTEELNRKGENARRLVENEFRWSKAAVKLIEAFSPENPSGAGTKSRPLLMVGRWRAESANGVDQTIVNLARSYVALGRKVTLWHPSRRAVAIRTEPLEDGIEQVTLPIRLAGIHLPRATREFIEARSGEFQVAHFHSVFTPSNCSIARLLRCPYTVTPNGGYNSPRGIGSQSWFRKLVFLWLRERRFLDRAAFVHLVAPRSEHNVRSLSAQQNFVESPNGQRIEASRMRSSRTREPRRPGVKRLLFVGRLAIEQKGLDRLLHALAASGSTAFHLILAGPDFRDGFRELSELAQQLNLTALIEFRPPVFGDAKWELIADSDVFVHFSRWEGMPFSVLEALSVGRPVLITAETNLAEAVSEFDAGWSANEGCLEDAVRACLAASPEEFREKGRNAIRLIEQRFQWPQIAARLLRAYDRFCP